ncbi:NAD-dependent succinate-semialdehyde dehydrogenase [Rhodospirillales bacterium TMPK1]|uniref:NAD-dependent succinate-semialdehyde dehydrogenase n=2 Tax=Roseiterribacter gracilis TaxID=2812848 RepID=A0A8S8X5X3_9PROT|nr:NAD-dependent succinate-semialdehyde dehydrogenase [Rhodospirillales bacterium TMPK1]
MLRDDPLYIDGAWRRGSAGTHTAIIDPATGTELGKLSHAGAKDLDDAAAAALRGFQVWSRTSAYDRSRVLRAAAQKLRERADDIAASMTREQGKPLREAKMEVVASADIVDWCAEEGRRVYVRGIPGRRPDIRQVAAPEPVGPVAAFTPWNFPVSQPIRKVAAALAAGCSMVLKPSEETPSAGIAIVEAFHDAGLPPGVLNLLFGDPAFVSSSLIPDPRIRKVSFTGSIPVGKQLAALAAQYMKPCTMELGGHAPVLVFDNVGVEATAKAIAAGKFRNAGQVCISPTRLFVQRGQYKDFVDAFSARASSMRLGPGHDDKTEMGPLANARRLSSIESFTEDARKAGARIAAGGARHGNAGNFWSPTVVADVPEHARLLTEEPFGPIVAILPFDSEEEVIARANALPFGLAAYMFDGDAHRADRVAAALEVGMVSINQGPLALPETPFGGVKESGYGREGGAEALLPYLVTKFISHAPPV